MKAAAQFRRALQFAALGNLWSTRNYTHPRSFSTSGRPADHANSMTT